MARKTEPVVLNGAANPVVPRGDIGATMALAVIREYLEWEWSIHRSQRRLPEGRVTRRVGLPSLLFKQFGVIDEV